jgi:ribosomal protein L11 methyltransferase
MTWVALSVEVPSSLAESLADLLVADGVTSVVTDVAESGAAGPTRLEAHVPARDGTMVAAALAAHVARLAAVDPKSVRVERVTLPDTDWEAVARRHHRPVAVGERLMVAPPWDIPASGGREVLVIEPGMAFGTGQHPTTRACLEEIEAAVAAGLVRSALDVGTGSGLLAVALVRLGVPRVAACDVDAAVLPLARANLARNDAGRVLLLGGRVGAVRGTFDLVVANLLADALVAEARALADAVAPGGRLVVSGVLAAQTDTVSAAFPGWRVGTERGGNLWRTMRLVRDH